MNSQQYQVNREIREREVRLVSETGEQMGVMPTRKALEIAESRELDLVKVQGNTSVPVCKLMDYGKFRFDQSKRERDNKKTQTVTEQKEVRLSPGIGQHDFDTKLKSARKFLQDGDRVKVAVRFRGREMTHTDIGRELLKKFAAACEDIATVTSEPKMDARQMLMILTPKK